MRSSRRLAKMRYEKKLSKTVLPNPNGFLGETREVLALKVTKRRDSTMLESSFFFIHHAKYRTV
jgi:hypothetical protein